MEILKLGRSEEKGYHDLRIRILVKEKRNRTLRMAL